MFRILKNLKLATTLIAPLLIVFLSLSPAAANDNFGFDVSVATPSSSGMCAGQGPATDKELRDALAVMGEIITLGPDLKSTDEETIIRGRGLTAARLNCLLGKIMAGNDIFGWGSPEAYGVGLTANERALVKKYDNESEGLKQYLVEELNIQVDDDASSTSKAK